MILEQAEKQGMQANAPSRKHQYKQRWHDKHLYKIRHLVENAFLDLKRWRGTITPYG